MSDILSSILDKARAAKKTIVLCEGDDPRVQEAAKIITEQKIASIKLIATCDPRIDGVETIIIDKLDTSKYASVLFEARKSKGMTESEAEVLAKNPLYLGALLVQCGECDGMVAGAINSTGDVLRPALQIIKTAKNVSVVSSCFLMIMPKSEGEKERVLVFSDCAIIPEPTSEQLAAIALSSALSAKTLAQIDEPRVAMLSFSTYQSAKHPNVDKVRAAVEIARGLDKDLVVDGDLQADAALVESVGQLKAKGSLVAGRANVLVFPDLQSGNIGYKLVERLAGAKAIGPICQGFNKPVNDLSRGCNAEDIVGVVALTALQAAAK